MKSEHMDTKKTPHFAMGRLCPETGQRYFV